MYIILPVVAPMFEVNMLLVSASHVGRERPDMILGYAYSFLRFICFDFGADLGCRGD